jgi:hypothetical protein
MGRIIATKPAVLRYMKATTKSWIVVRLLARHEQDWDRVARTNTGLGHESSQAHAKSATGYNKHTVPV